MTPRSDGTPIDTGVGRSPLAAGRAGQASPQARSGLGHTVTIPNAFIRGPWRVAQKYGPDGWCIAAAGNAIATAHYLGGTEPAKANARLIAAAPDMFEALLDIRNRILCPVGPSPTLDEIAQIAGAAIRDNGGIEDTTE